MKDLLIHQLPLCFARILHLQSVCFLPFSLFAVNVSRLVFNRFVKTDQDTTRFLFAQRSVHFALFFFCTVFHCFFSVCCFCCPISVSASVSVAVSGCLRSSCKTIFEDLRRNCFKLFDFVARCLQLDCAPLPLPLPHALGLGMPRPAVE